MILIGTDDGIYRWFEGSGWPVFHGLQGRSVVGLASPGAGVIAAVERSGDVYESVDNGISWRHLPMPSGSGRPSAIAFDGMPPSLVVAVKPLNLYRRGVGAIVPRARSAPAATAGFAPKLVHQARGLAERGTALIAPGRPKAPHSAEAVRMAGWAPLTAPHAPRAAVQPEVRSIATVPGAWLAAVSGAGLWKSVDFGRSWTQCPSLPVEVFALRTVPGRPGHVWAATHDGCRLSTDAGQTWEDRSAGLENVRHVQALEVKPDAPDTLLVGAAPAGPKSGAAPREGLNFGLYESSNGGKSWAQVVKKNFPEDVEYDTISDIRYDPSAPDNVVVALGSGELWVTRNGGAYWGPLARQIRAARVLCAVA